MSASATPTVFGRSEVTALLHVAGADHRRLALCGGLSTWDPWCRRRRRWCDLGACAAVSRVTSDEARHGPECAFSPPPSLLRKPFRIGHESVREPRQSQQPPSCALSLVSTCSKSLEYYTRGREPLRSLARAPICALSCPALSNRIESQRYRAAEARERPTYALSLVQPFRVKCEAKGRDPRRSLAAAPCRALFLVSHLTLPMTTVSLFQLNLIT